MENTRVKSKLVISLAVVSTYAAMQFVPEFYAYVIFGKDRFNAMNYTTLLCHDTNVVLCFIVTLCLAGFSFKKMLEMLGLNNGLATAFLLALLASLPMIVGLPLLHGFRHGVSFMDIWFNGIHPGYHEEIVFRGFLTGILVRYGKWPAVIPLILSSALFAMGHLYQAHNLPESVTVFLMAFGAGTGFYLFYKYSNWNLWFPIFLHSFMDTSTVISNWNGNILMNFQDNIFRGATLAIAIFIVVRISIKAKNKVEPLA